MHWFLPFLIGVLAPDSSAVAAPVAYSVADSAKVQAVVAFRDARERSDSEAVKALLGTDPRIWFDKKIGSGTKLTPAGGGPWSEWDKYFRAESRIDGEFAVKGRRVSVTVEETNDFYRLCERDAGRHQAIYFLDEHNRVTGILIQAIENPAGRDRFDDARAWIEKHHPQELRALMPAGDIVPSLQKARRWRKLLNQWRASANLPPIQQKE